MQLIITDSRLAKSRVLQVGGLALALWLTGIFLVVTLISGAVYHWVLLKGAREGWPVISTVMRLVVREEFEQRDRYLRENIEVMAKKTGELQAKMLQLQSLAERVSGLAGINPEAIKVQPGQGGALVAGRNLSLQELEATLQLLDQTASQRTDVMTAIESRLFEQKMKKMMLPTQTPVPNVATGSGFGMRIDPFRGLSAVHEGLDFPAAPGTPIYAAAGGVIVTQEFHFQFGNFLEIDHGNDLLTRYAHSSRVFVKKGDLVKRGQKIAEVGSSGRSTGSHLHFEVLVKGVAHDPQRFLAASALKPAIATAQR